MRSNELKLMLGLVTQTDRLISDQGILKIFTSINFDDSRDIYDVIEQVNKSGLSKAVISPNEFIKYDDYLNSHTKANISVIPFGDEYYPLCLAMTPNPPAMLYIKGNKDILLEMPGVAIVGSRDVSMAGEEITRRITTKVCDNGYVIISGLAIGTDTNAHKAALKAKAKTIAVLAHGLDTAKPRQNAKLAEEILFTGGAWISEYPIGRPAWKQSFVQRNRIQVGLSSVSLLIEAALNSGTMTQAEFAIKAARPIFAVVPHTPLNPLKLNCEGTSKLVENGSARPLRTSNDYDELISCIVNSSQKIKKYSEIYKSNTVGSLL